MTLSRCSFLILSLLCGALGCLVFLPGLPGDFILDDISAIVENAGIRLQSLDPGPLLQTAFSHQFGGAFRVLPKLTFALDYYRGGGLDPETFKTTNIAIHSLTTVMLAWFLRKLLVLAGVTSRRAHWTALGMALVWALHPLQVASVLYVVQRMQIMATLFVLLSLWIYLQARQAQMDGRPGRTGWMLVGLSWAMAMACKEDAVLLPAYMLALELTVLRFRAATPALAKQLRRGYLLLTIIGASAFVLFVVPYFWSSEHYPGRNFSSYERLLTQGRVLWMYVWQTLLPLPSHMTFYYDWIQPSRGLLQPWITLPALGLLAAWMAVAWRLRHMRPLFALGTFLFLAGHFVTSNVVGLELAFEHRNHFALVGMVLTVGDLLAWAAARLDVPATARISACGLAIIALGGATMVRAKSWNSGLQFALTSTQLAPGSARAWNALCLVHFERGGGERRDNPYLDKAISACSKGAATGADSITSLTNVLVFKGLQGSVTLADWAAYHDRIARVTMTAENASRIWVLMDQVRKGSALDPEQVISAIETFHRRASFKPIESAAAGYFVFGHGRQPLMAYPYFEHAVSTTRDPAFARSLIADMRKEGHPDWAARLQAVERQHD